MKKVLSWGEPVIEVGILEDDDTVKNWIKLPESVRDSSQLTTEPGETTDALDEGGAIIDQLQEASKYTFETTLFIKEGDEKPIEDKNGVIDHRVSVRWFHKSRKLKGRVLDKASVSVVETWTRGEGGRLRYVFVGLSPKTGDILKSYQPPADPSGGG